MGGEPEGPRGNYLENRERWTPGGPKEPASWFCGGTCRMMQFEGTYPSSPSLEQSAF